MKDRIELNKTVGGRINTLLDNIDYSIKISEQLNKTVDPIAWHRLDAEQRAYKEVYRLLCSYFSEEMHAYEVADAQLREERHERDKYQDSDIWAAAENDMSEQILSIINKGREAQGDE